ncbi:MAG: MerR family DNA-binding transcriptional regulator [Anaerolineaceae bacterium]|nr:MerR family DNA-binding transcriptional regulator [Anaerolineaceae bacterium]
MTQETLLTIGQLGKLAQMPPSTLRYYEKEGLLQPNGRSPLATGFTNPKRPNDSTSSSAPSGWASPWQTSARCWLAGTRAPLAATR